mgnify:CR=1 FL=1
MGPGRFRGSEHGRGRRDAGHQDRAPAVPDQQRERREQKETAMDKRHRMATAAYRLEQYIWGGDTYHPADLTDEIEALDAPEALKYQLHFVAEAFLRREADLDLLQDELEGTLDIDDLDEDAEHVAEAIFVSIVDEVPQGRVTIRREPGFFVMEYDVKQDFADVTADCNNKRDRDALAQSWGMYHNRSPVCIRADHSVEHIDFPVYDEEYEMRVDDVAPIIHVNRAKVAEETGSEADIEEAVRALTRHERSHAIFDYFENHHDNFDNVKDELLARIREGATPEETTDFLDDQEGYAYLRKGKEKRDIEEALTVLHESRWSVDDVEDVFIVPEHRGVLTYHLMDIDFVDIPDHLVELTRHYTERLQPLIDVGPPEEDDPHSQAVAAIRAEKNPSLLATDVVTAYDAWVDLYERLYDRMILEDPDNVDELVQRLSALEYHAHESYVTYQASIS